MAEGVVPGGVLIRKRALETPARQIAANSGVDGGVVVERMINPGQLLAAGTTPTTTRRTDPAIPPRQGGQV